MNSCTQVVAQVELDVPLAGPFDYLLPEGVPAKVGARIVVPWRNTRQVGLVRALAASSQVPRERLRNAQRVLDAEPLLDERWWSLIDFAARYYQRPAGEIALPALPKLLRAVPAARSKASAIDRLRRGRGDAADVAALPAAPGLSRSASPALNAEQGAALAALSRTGGFAVHVLHGVTGSGKTEVYLHWFDAILARPGTQVLLLVPEIALTPQLTALLRARFADHHGVALLHSALAEGERAAHWLSAAEGRARIVVGTRLAVLAPMPGLAAIVVDEEHDPSFKQHEGAQYSARDLAIIRAQQLGIGVVLGSATPSLETWHAIERGRYTRLALHARAAGAVLPEVSIVDVRRATLRHGLSEPVLAAMGDTLARGQQILVFLNRRGYAPVLACESCGWLSRCADCAAYQVLHRVGAAPANATRAARYRLVCHHCSSIVPVPRACPTCGNVALEPVGRGTQRLEQGLTELFAQARIARLDRDVARRSGAAEAVLQAVHDRQVDIVLGTQMLAKGHDFAHLALVVVADADSALYAADFRAPERLFATLMQVAGRAGRAQAAGRVLVQTRFASHPLFAALKAHDYPRFADAQLAERRASSLPPFVHQALLRLEHPALEDALAFGARARELALSLPDAAGGAVRVYDAVPMPIERIAGESRAQLLIESAARSALQRLLAQFMAMLREERTRVRWQLEVDPLEI